MPHKPLLLPKYPRAQLQKLSKDCNLEISDVKTGLKTLKEKGIINIKEDQDVRTIMVVLPMEENVSPSEKEKQLLDGLIKYIAHY